MLPLRLIRILCAAPFGVLLTFPIPACAYPVSSLLTEMVESQAPGTWLRVNQNQFQDVWTPKAQRSSPGAGSPKYVISAWSGGGYDSNTGDFYVWGGDNGTYSGNEVYRWRAASLSWERLSLPSAIKSFQAASGKKMWTTVDGVDNTPISGETFDNVVFLPNVNRLAIMGGNAYPGNGLQYFREDRLTRAGPYFFDPTKADANKVGGITGSHVNPGAFPDVVGGEMWQNRQSIHTSAGLIGPKSLGGGVSAVTSIDGKDVVFVGETGKGRHGRLFKYTVNSLNPSEDVWEVVGTMGKNTFSGTGVGAYDPTRNIFLRTAKRTFRELDEATGLYVKRTTAALMYWDLNNAGPNNPRIRIPWETLIGDALPYTNTFGMDYDPVTDAFYIWAGTNDVWILKPPQTFGPTGWIVQRLTPDPIGPIATSSKYPMVYGKWNYMSGLGAFMGVANSITGDVWVYKPQLGEFSVDGLDFAGSEIALYERMRTSAYPVADTAATGVPEPSTLLLLVIGMAALLRRGQISVSGHSGAPPMSACGVIAPVM